MQYFFLQRNLNCCPLVTWRPSKLTAQMYVTKVLKTFFGKFSKNHLNLVLLCSYKEKVVLLSFGLVAQQANEVNYSNKFYKGVELFCWQV